MNELTEENLIKTLVEIGNKGQNKMNIRELLIREIEEARNRLKACSKHIYDVYGDGYPFEGYQYIHDMADSCTLNMRKKRILFKLGQLLLELDKYDNNGKNVGYMDL